MLALFWCQSRVLGPQFGHTKKVEAKQQQPHKPRVRQFEPAAVSVSCSSTWVKIKHFSGAVSPPGFLADAFMIKSTKLEAEEAKTVEGEPERVAAVQPSRARPATFTSFYTQGQ